MPDFGPVKTSDFVALFVACFRGYVPVWVAGRLAACVPV
jgi:hypothetical protein